MKLPEHLQAAINQIACSLPANELKKAFEDISNCYRSECPLSKFETSVQRVAYLLARMPATYAAVYAVLEELKRRLPTLKLTSLLDLGAGPGTVLWALQAIFPEIEKAKLVEKNSQMLTLGKQLLRGFENVQIEWDAQTLETAFNLEPTQLVCLSYALGEFAPSQQDAILSKVWIATKHILVIIEPGTPKGFQNILEARKSLISWGAHLVAPCPGHMKCSKEGLGWCHFAVRLERSVLHRQVKQAELGYEDEKYSYIVASKQPCALPQARIVEHPQVRSGHVNLVLCTLQGLQKQIISKKQAELYKQARKWQWGDAIE